MNKLNLPLNRVLAYGIMYQLRYEFAANEGSMLNGLELDPEWSGVGSPGDDNFRLMREL